MIVFKTGFVNKKGDMIAFEGIKSFISYHKLSFLEGQLQNLTKTIEFA